MPVHGLNTEILCFLRDKTNLSANFSAYDFTHLWGGRVCGSSRPNKKGPRKPVSEETGNELARALKTMAGFLSRPCSELWPRYGGRGL